MGPELLCLRREARRRDSGTLVFLGMQSLTQSLCVSPSLLAMLHAFQRDAAFLCLPGPVTVVFLEQFLCSEALQSDFCSTRN